MRNRDCFAILLLAVPACATGNTAATASDITAAIPQAQWLDIQTASTTPVDDTVPAPSSPAPMSTCQGGPPAMFAAMSGQVMGGANGVIGGILGAVGSITQGPPALQTPDHAVWGPLGAPNDPVVRRLDIARVAPDAFHFVLSARPVAGDESTWRGVFQGDVHSPDPDHADGDAAIDFAAIHSLDPTSDPIAGTIAIHFASAPDARMIDDTFAGITGAMAPHPNDAHYHFEQDATGVRFAFGTRTDFDHDGTADELVDVEARFAPDGSGKASTVVSGGSMGTAHVGALECWDNQQHVVFYADDANANPPAGDPGCCVM